MEGWKLLPIELPDHKQSYRFMNNISLVYPFHEQQSLGHDSYTKQLHSEMRMFFSHRVNRDYAYLIMNGY